MIYLMLVIFLLVGGTLTVLTIQNLETAVPLSVFALQTPSLPVGLLLLFSFILGALLLYLLALASAWRDTRNLKKLRQRIAELEQAAANMVAPLSAPGISAIPMPGMPNPNPEQPQQPQQPQG